jgi:hypothetical protein
MEAQMWSGRRTNLDPRRGLEVGRPWYPVVGVVALIALAAALWRNRRWQTSARIAAREAGLEPKPVVY